MSELTYPCTITGCDGTARLAFDNAHYEGDQIVGDRIIYRCPDCTHIWDEKGQPLGKETRDE